jgi:hypothetical protein
MQKPKGNVRPVLFHFFTHFDTFPTAPLRHCIAQTPEILVQEAAGSEGDGSFSGDKLVVDDGANDDHAEASIHEFCILLAVESIGCFGQTQGVETELTRPPRGALHHLNDRGDTSDDLEPTDPQEELDHGALGDAPVVGGAGEGRGVSVEGQPVEVLDEEAEDGKHADAAVLDFCLAQELHVHKVGETERVKRGLVAHPASQVRLGIQERHCRGLGHRPLGRHRPHWRDGGHAARERGRRERDTAGGNESEHGENKRNENKETSQRTRG